MAIMENLLFIMVIRSPPRFSSRMSSKLLIDMRSRFRSKFFFLLQTSKVLVSRKKYSDVMQKSMYKT